VGDGVGEDGWPRRGEERMRWRGSAHEFMQRDTHPCTLTCHNARMRPCICAEQVGPNHTPADDRGGRLPRCVGVLSLGTRPSFSSSSRL
jgi:hypothetical protein